MATLSVQSPSIHVSGDRLAISGPVAGGPIQNVAAWGSKSPPPSKEKRNIFGFKSKTEEEAANKRHERDLRNGPPSAKLHMGRPVFGMPLAEAAQLFPPIGVDVLLPAIVYRCIEFLTRFEAALQQGIFRESGLSHTITALQERFNAEGDVNLLELQNIENNDVADLLKRYLRELPDSTLTRELHSAFARVMGKLVELSFSGEGSTNACVENRQYDDKVDALNVLVHRLPEPNLELLAALSHYLRTVVQHATRNLMTEKNSKYWRPAWSYRY